MKVQGHSIDEQWDLIQQFEGLVEHGLTAVAETWLEHHDVPSALTAAAEGETLLDGEGSFAALWQSQVEGVFTTYLTSVYDASSLAIAHEAMSQADLASGLGVAGVPDDYSADFVAKTTNKMVGVSDQVWHNIRTQLAQGVSANETIEELADRVRTAISVSMPRALTVARTTVIAASNAGSYAQASLLAGEGGMRKTWVATEDNRVRPDHHNADGQTVSMTAMFIVGGFPMAYPGDPTAPPEEVINCRCTITYEFDELASVCECGSEPALVAAVKAPKVQVPMGASCICPAVSSITPAGYKSKLTKAYDSAKKKVYADFQADGKITPSIGGAKIHKRLQQVIAQNSGLLGPGDIEELLNVIDEQYALAGGKTSFKAKYEEWLQTNAGKKAVPQAVVTPLTSPPGVAPAVIEPRGLAVIKAPKPANLKVVGGAGGTHGAKILVDQSTGERWLFKPYSSGSEFGAKLDVSTARLQSRMGLPQPSTHTIRWNGQYGSVQSMHDATEAFPGGKYDPLKFSEADILDLQREQVLDWLISNNDSHSGNFLRLSNGHLVGIDKGQAFKYLKQDTNLDWSVVLHSPLAPDKLVYQPLWRAFAEGKNIQLFDPSTGALRELIEQTMAIPDAEFRDILRPFAEQAFKDGKLAYGDVEKFLDVMVQRKNNLAADFQKMYDKALAERAKVLGPPVTAPAPVVPVVAPAVSPSSLIAPVAPSAGIDYAGLWDQLDNLEQDNFIKAFKDAKSYHDSGAPLDEVMQLLKQDIIDNPSEWMSVVKNSGTDDLKGLIKVAGDALGNDTSWLGLSGKPSALAAPAGNPADLAAAKLLLQPIDLDELGSELKYQVNAGSADLAEAIQYTLNELPKFMSKQAVSTIENLTNDQIFALIKDYQTSVGQSTDWIDAALAKSTPPPPAAVTPAATVMPPAPTVVVPMTTEDVYGVAQSLGLSKSDLPSLMFDFKVQSVNFPGDLPGLIAKIRSISTTNLTKKGAKALTKISDEDLAKLVKDYGDSLGKDTSFITLPVPSATPVAPISTAVDLLDISHVPDSLAKSFYQTYKQLKPVTPSWGGAAIFKNLQMLKGTLGPEFAGLNDGQLLKLLDKVWYQNAKPGSKSYYNEVTAWLKTPGGKKYLKDNGLMAPPEPGGITPSAVKAPSAAPAAPIIPPVAPAAPAAPAKAAKAAKKAAKPKAAPKVLDTQKFLDAVPDAELDTLADDFQPLYQAYGGNLSKTVETLKIAGKIPSDWTAAGLTDDQITTLIKLHADKAGKTTTFPIPSGVKMKKLPTPAVKFAAADGDISGIDAGLKQTIFQKIKGQSVYLSSTGQKIWDVLEQVSKLPGMTDASGKPKFTKLQLVRILDEQSAAKFGVTNTSQYEQKLVKWLKTPAGKAHASGLPKTPSYPGAPSSVGGPKFDPGPTPRMVSTQPESFSIISTREASQMQAAKPFTASQRAGLRYYTSNAGYDAMNAALREGRAVSSTTARHIREAQAGMSPSTRPMMIHRGTGADQFTELGVRTRTAPFDQIKALEGQEFTDEAFMSTSVGGKAAFGGKPVLLEIEAPTGTSMAYIADISNYGHEDEMLLAAGTRFKILHVSQSGSGYYSPIVVRVRVLPQ